jgi:hypothetical protein
MSGDRISDLIRSANPAVQSPKKSTDDAWHDVVVAIESERYRVFMPSRRMHRDGSRRRRLLTASAAALLVASAVTIVSLQEKHTLPSLTSAFAKAFGVVNADAATSGGFTATPPSPQGSNEMTCPSREVCYLESTNVAGPNSELTVTKVFKTVDGGATWSQVAMPSPQFLDTPLSCPSDSVCSVGAEYDPAVSHSGPYPKGTSQSMLTTTDGGATWTSHRVTIDPVLGYDSSVDPSLAGVQGQWMQLQCFDATSCIAVALVASDQPEQPRDAGSPPTTVQRTMVMRTDDGGASWTSTVLPWSSARDGSPAWSNAQPMSMSCASSMVCLGISTVFHSVVGNSQTASVVVWRSVDGGRTWRSNWVPSSAVGTSLQLTCPTTQRCWALVTMGEGNLALSTPGVITTNNGGQSWSVVTPPFPEGSSSVDRYNTVSCTTSSTCWIGGGVTTPGETSRAAIWATQDAGRTWMSAPLPVKLGYVFQVVCNAPDSCLAVAQPPYNSGQAIPSGPLPGEILSNQLG